MTVSPVSLVDIEQTMAQLQQVSGAPERGSGPSAASTVDAAGNDFASSLDQATSGASNDLFAAAIAADAGGADALRSRDNVRVDIAA